MGKHEKPKHFITREELVYIRDEFKRGTECKIMAAKLDIPEESIHVYIRRLKNAGELPDIRKKKNKHTGPYVKVIKKSAYEENPALLTTAPPEEVKGVKCTYAVSKTCIYGCTPATKDMGLCNFILIHKKKRPCSPLNCTCYSKITKENKRRFVKEVEEVEE